MSPRSLRRAASRAASKEAICPVVPSAAPYSPATNQTTAPVSAVRLAANRANAQLSTGPNSEAGKRVSSLNAVKSALTGQTVLLPSDDVALYEALVLSFVGQWKPVTEEERRLVQSLADTQWRLNRIPALETGLFARGRIEFAEKFAGYDASLAASLMDTETLVVYEKPLRNLHAQEDRLRRQFAKDVIALTALVEARTEAQPEAVATPAAAIVDRIATAAKVGFEFTTENQLRSHMSLGTPLQLSEAA